MNEDAIKHSSIEITVCGKVISIATALTLEDPDKKRPAEGYALAEVYRVFI